jgi:homoserine O-acetyltransferase
MWRKMICDSIRDDPEWQDGEYRHQPPNLRIAAEILYFMGSNPRLQYEHAPTGAKADEVLARSADNAMKTMDANDVLYAVDSSRDYDPASTLEKITAPLLAVNSADDLINPPDLGILEREIKRVPHGATITIPEGPETQGHGTHTLAKLWKSDLANLLQRTNGNGGQ